MYESDWFDEWFPNLNSRDSIESMVWIVTHEVSNAIYQNYLRKIFTEEFLSENLREASDVEDRYDLDDFFNNRIDLWSREVRHIRDGILRQEMVRYGWINFHKLTQKIEENEWAIDPEWLKAALHIAQVISDEELFSNLAMLEIYLTNPQAREWRKEILFILEADRKRYLYGDDSDYEEKILIEQAIEISGVFNPKLNSIDYSPFGEPSHSHGKNSYPDFGWVSREIVDKETAFEKARNGEKVKLHNRCRVIFNGGQWECVGEAPQEERPKPVTVDPLSRMHEALDEMTGVLPHLFDPGKDKHFIMAQIEVEKHGDFEVPVLALLQTMILWTDENAQKSIKAFASSNPFENHPEIKVNLAAALAQMAESRVPERSSTGLCLVTALTSSDAKLLHALAHHSCPVVRIAVLNNDQTHLQTFRFLSSDSISEVRAKTALNEDVAKNSVDADVEFVDYKCICIDKDKGRSDSILKFQEYISKNRLRLPRAFDVNEGISNFGKGYWATIPYPTPWEDYWYEPRGSETLDWGTLEYFKYIPENHFAITYAGHGVNSFGMNIRIVHGQVAILGQVGWGGVYGDPEREKQTWSDMIYLIDRVLDVQKLNKSSRINYILGLSDFRGDVLYTRDPKGNWVRGDRQDRLSLISNLVSTLQFAN